MSIITSSKLESLSEEQKRKFQGLLPELIKKLILSSSIDVNKVRIPNNDDVWAPGFDGVIEVSDSSTYIQEGMSVWEFGTSSNSMEKIDSDYEKRTKNPLGLDKTTTTFYLVVPKVWAYHTSITEWENSKKDWKSVHVYDACILCDWINSCPNVCAWLFEEVFGETLSFYTLKEAWDRCCKKTSPSLSASIFLNGRAETKELFINSVKTQSIVRVKSNISLDAYGFCLSALLKDKELSEKTIVIKDYHTYERFSREFKGKIFLLDFPMTADIVDSNANILCYNKEDTSVRADFELPPLSKANFKSALKDMWNADHDIEELYEFTHGNLLALIRRIPGTSTMSAPNWKKQDQIELLTPLMFVRHYNMGEAADKYMLEALSGASYDNLYQLYSKWEALEDAPLKYINGQYCTIINYEESWETLNISTKSDSFKRLSAFICNICSIKSDFPQEYFHRCRKHLRSLLLNLIYVSYSEPNSVELSELVKNVFLLAQQTTDNEVMSTLSLLAEACPERIMEMLEKDFKSENGITLSFLKTYHYTYILHALEILATFDTTKIRACKMLFELMDVACNKTYSNSPKDSLSTALCLWYTKGSLTLDEKVRFLKKQFLTCPIKAAYFTVDLIQKDNLAVGVRLGAKQNSNEEIITIKQLQDTNNELALLVAETAMSNKDLSLLHKLIDGYRILTADTLNSIANSFNKLDYDLSEIIKVNFEIRCTVDWIIRRKDNEDNYWIQPLKHWQEITTPDDIFGANAWAFAEYYKCPAWEIAEDSKEEASFIHTEEDWEFRKNLFAKILKSLGKDFYILLIDTLKDDSAWGRFFACVVPTDTYDYLCELLIKSKKIYILSSFIDSIDLDNAKMILLSLDAEVQGDVLHNIQRIDIATILSTDSMKLSFWSNYRMFEYSDMAYANLMLFNPWALADYYMYHFKGDLSAVLDDVMVVLNSISKSELIAQKLPMYKFTMDSLVKKIDDLIYTEEFAELCTVFYKNKIINHLPQAIKRLFFEKPSEIIEELNNNGQGFLGYFFFWHDYKLPNMAFESYDKFKFFCNILAQSSNTEKHILGNILGRCDNGMDGIFPHEFVREILDEYNDAEVNRGFLIGKFNSLGVRTVGDGSDEKDLGDMYLNNAKKIEIDYPVTASLLRTIAKGHLDTASQDSAMFELGFDI